MRLSEALYRAQGGQSLGEDEAKSLMAALVEDELDEPTFIAWLSALRTNGATGDELRGFVACLSERCVKVLNQNWAIDTCGTGGGQPTFNISTAAAILASAAGASVAKHGNRAVTSSCGSADVLEALGIGVVEDPVKAAELIDEAGFVFLFAPKFHPALAKFGPIRRRLPFRTVFNQLGPLLNPASLIGQVIGVAEASMAQPTAEACTSTGSCFVVYGISDTDEVSPKDATMAIRANAGQTKMSMLRPESFGLETEHRELEVPSNPAEAALALSTALTDAGSVECSYVVPNAALALFVAGVAQTLPHGAELAKETVRNGAAWAKVEELKRLCPTG